MRITASGRQDSPFPGASAISKAGNTACDNAFRSYVGVALAKSVYTWTNIIPDASTWPMGDRALHCIAYYATPRRPTGAKLTGSLKGPAGSTRARRARAGRAGGGPG